MTVGSVTQQSQWNGMRITVCQAVSFQACEVMTIPLLLLILGNTELNDQFAVMLLVEAYNYSLYFNCYGLVCSRPVANFPPLAVPARTLQYGLEYYI